MSWSRNKLALLATVVFGAQIGGIFALHTREPLRVRIPPLTPGLIGGFMTNSVGSDVEELIDPLAFAGAHEHGFSGNAWLKQARMEIAVSNSIPKPTFFGFERVATDPATANGFRGLAPELPMVQLSVSSAPGKSTFRVQGEVAKRELLTKMNPPIQFGTDVMSNTVVQVAVRADGFPFTARIIAGSGSRGADLTALQLANDAQFAPLPASEKHGASVQWGEFVFQWFTAAPPTTNATAQATK